MGNTKRIGRVRVSAAALGLGNVRHAGTRMTVSVVVAAVVVATAVSVPESTGSPAVRLSADSTALILGGTTVPTPDDYYIDTVENHFIAPTHPGQDIDYVAVTTPEEFWPITGFGRIVWRVLGPPSIWGPGGAGWPDEPWWKLSGLFDLTIGQSIKAGVADLEQAMAEHGNDRLVIYGYSQGAIIANLEKRKLAEQHSAGTTAPDIDFVLSGDLNIPNGGIFARCPGLYVPILDLSFNGSEPTDTAFDSVAITLQYDGLADFPLYPLNLVADLNALLGVVYVHPYDLDVSLADSTSAPAVSKDPTGKASYYFIENPDLPLFAPLRTLGVPESVIDVVEPFFRVIVELGYDRSIPPWKPTPARLIPIHDPVTVAADLLDAIGEGIRNVAAIAGSATPPGTHLADILRQTQDQRTESLDADLAGQQDQAGEQALHVPGSAIGKISDRLSKVVAAVGSRPPDEPAAGRQPRKRPQHTVGEQLAGSRDRVNDTIGAVRPVVENDRIAVASAGNEGGSGTLSSPARKTPVRDAVNKAGADVKKAVSTVSHVVKKVLSRGSADDHTGDAGTGG